MPTETAEQPTQTDRLAILFARGFRPFFLLAGGYAFALLLFWLAILSGYGVAPHWLPAVTWHAHEMVFGFVAAAVAGFLLTSVPVWTQTQPVVGGHLAALVMLWLAGRVAVAAAGLLPPLWVAVIDIAFLPAVAASIAVPLVSARQLRNYGFVGILLVLACANAAIHLEAAHAVQSGAQLGLRLSVFLMAVMVVTLGGRLVPLFTRNALARTGSSAHVRSFPLVDRLSVAAAVAFVVTDLAAPNSRWSGAVALVTSALLVLRIAGWQTLRTLGDPLLWSLHLGYLWVIAGYACVATSDLFALLPWTTGLHAFTAGAFGTMILAVMTRVALGHTGRPLEAPPGIPLAYALVAVGALLRILAPVVFPAEMLNVITVAGLLWASGFALFSAIYFPLLTSPRVDGLPG